MTSVTVASFFVGIFIGFFLGLGWLCEIVSDIEEGRTKADYLQREEKLLK